MELSERERLRQRLNFPEPTVDTPVHVPLSAPLLGADPEAEPQVIGAEQPLEAAALSRLADLIERLDERIEGNRVELEQISQRLDRLEGGIRGVGPDGEERVGIEAVRRTVAASHRALTSQLTRMIDEVEARVLRQVRSDAPVGAAASPDAG